MYERMIQAEVDYRRARLTRGKPSRRRAASRGSAPLGGDQPQTTRRVR